MLSELLSNKAKQKIVDELSEVIDELAETKAKQINKRYLNITEAHEYLGLGYNTFSKLRESGEILPIQIKGIAKTLFDRKVLDEFMQSHQL